MKEYQNYLFDLYGTLADIHTDEESDSFWRSVSRLVGMYGNPVSPKELKEHYQSEIARLEAEARNGFDGVPEIDLTPVFREFLGKDGDVSEFAKAFRVLSLKKLRLFPGVKQLLEQLHREGKGAYLLSNAQSLFTRPELTLLGLDKQLNGIVLSSEVGIKKPDPNFYRHILKKYNLNPETTAMVGNDDIADCHGAAAAGLDSFYVCTEQSPVRVKPLPENCTELEKIGNLLKFVI